MTRVETPMREFNYQALHLHFNLGAVSCSHRLLSSWTRCQAAPVNRTEAQPKI
ncbi:hypothetical protein BJY01DRAFT_229063 [Aspergillus pseudoustus]|uniref:Uncharacterized protein n=1 Tax=Aspergillus pseudoustus TaxID=1810923 RepID=A0ABR4IIC6_9EURO